MKFLLLAVAGMTAGVLFAQQAPMSDTVVNPLADNPTAAAEGQRIYDGTCQTCHGPAGVGDRDRGGSPLNTTGLKQGDGDADLFRTIRTGVTGTQMPSYKGLRDEQVWQLVSYIRLLQNAPASTRGTPQAPEGDVASGEALFFGKAACSRCHEVNARGGVTGPDLSNAGRLASAAIRQKIVAPSQPLPPAPGARGGGGRGGPAPVTIVARMQDGREIRGVRRNEDTFSVQIVDASGQLHMLDKLKLVSLTAETQSLMPGDYASRLSADEITNIVAFLRMQQGRDFTKTVAQTITGGVGYDRLLKAKAEPHNWLMYWGDYQGTHYSPLSQITPNNIRHLKAAWSLPILGGNSVLQATPLVVDGIMYTTGSGRPATVTAIDARSGRQIWRWTRQQATVNPYEINPFARGVSILGNRLFVGTLDGVLVALDARTGQPLWETPVVDTMEGSSITSPPLAIKDMVITGMTGGEFATRGFLDAYDAATGKRRWRFYTIPAPGEFGNDTWKGDSWKTGGGPTWLPGTYDPELNLLYWAIGNPAPEFDRVSRGEMDNLFTNSVVALDPDTGTMKWHYQFTPDDGHDWDSVQDMMLVDRVWRGQNRKLLLHADRNGHFYVLDRTNGTFLSGTPFIYQNWNAGFDANGRPQQIPGSNATPQGSFLVYPTVGGATNFQSPSYSPLTGWFYLAFSEGGTVYTSAPQPITRGQQYLGRGRAAGALPARGPNQPATNAGIKALDPETGETKWSFKIFQGSLTNGVLATSGNVLFVSERHGSLIALDAKSGKYLWHFQTGGANAASPMSYAIDGKQYVALAAGNAVFSFALEE
ncbi:MAG TPA: PQQ-dependent dehydrogenase, methanol/ethanol family [Vicinamibacterales bacterium]|nr:PQQ-dependent dehydrogenase, methanol/ethanol family [Vicinamibacterales bacterium]